MFDDRSRDGRGAGPPDTPASLRGIRKTFGSIEALRGVDLDLGPGECLGLVGDNAAGKSTLTKVLSGTYIPDDGTITLDGEPIRITGPPRHAPPDPDGLSGPILCDHIDVAGNLYLGRELTCGPFIDRRHADRRAADLEALEIRIPRLTPCPISRVASASRSPSPGPPPSSPVSSSWTSLPPRWPWPRWRPCSGSSSA